MRPPRVTRKPRLFTPAAPRLDTPTDPSSKPPPMQPVAPYPGRDRRNPLGLRHWISILSLLFGLVALAQAQPREEGLAFRGEGGWEPALALDTAVEMKIRGLVGEVVVRQRYVNDSPRWQEARYLLPLPPQAAVGRLRVNIGTRLIEGEVREKEAARQAYAEAARQGRSAALVEQQRPNLFRTGLTNIAPGETIEVEIGYWQAIDYRDGEFSIALPLTLTPPYTPAGPKLAQDVDGSPLPTAATTRRTAMEPTVSLRVDLAAGVPLAAIDSPTHAITVQPLAGAQRIELADLVELADRDFELRWRPLPSAQPQRAVFTEEVDGEHYALVMLLPPTLPVAALPRELILVVDTSGSMHGVAMAQAIDALDRALTRLGPDDRFNLVQFNHASSQLFPESVPATPQHVTRARRHVAALRADGGTEMAPALRMAFAGDVPAGMVRQVVLATDAAIGNEAELFAIVERERGDARLFPVGIGSAPNAHFIRKAAELGRGSHAVIRELGEVEARMGELFVRLDRPMLSEIDLHWPDAAEVFPERVPDLYFGEPLVIVARLPVLQGELDIGGRTREKPWRSKLRLDPLHVIQAEGVSRLWGRARIEAIEDAVRAGLAEEEGRKLIVETALRHGLASRHTSLVAVERTPRRAADAPLQATDIANAAPADGLALAQGSTDARSRLGLALTLCLMAAALWRRRQAPIEPGVA